MKQKNLNLVLLALVLIALGVLSRLSAHAWNFTIMGGLALFSGAFFSRKWVPVVIVYSSLLVSDFVIGFHNQMPAVYFSFALMILAGAFLKVNSSRLAWVSTAVLGSFVFFIVSNFFVWAEGSLYAPNWNGLLNCYTMAIPFYRTQLAADVVSTFALVEAAKSMTSFLVSRLDAAEVKLIS